MEGIISGMGHVDQSKAQVNLEKIVYNYYIAKEAAV